MLFGLLMRRKYWCAIIADIWGGFVRSEDPERNSGRETFANLFRDAESEECCRAADLLGVPLELLSQME
jgi:hypothetical protein